MCPLAKGAYHGPAPIPAEGKWVKAKEIKDLSGFTHGVGCSGMTDTMGRMHSDAQFAGSSSVPAHVEMMGLISMGNNPMVGASVAVAVAVSEAMKR